PQLHNPDGSVQQSYYRFARPLTPVYRRTILSRTWMGKRHLQYYFMRDVQQKESMPVDWLLGASLCMRKRDFEEVGMMDESFFLYFEDVDLCRSFWKSGKAVHYVPDATMVHLYHRQSAGQGAADVFKNVTRVHITSCVKYFIKHGVSHYEPTSS
ncbi:MAG: glycosyltransferase family 2 protein, partial [Patescibacteria group bacterium]